MYRLVQSGVPPGDQVVQERCLEFKHLVHLWTGLFLDEQGILRVTLPRQGRDHQLVVCPTELRRETVWDCHLLTHGGVKCTASRLHLTWYWYGLTSDVRKAVATCEVCQAAKQGLHLGQPDSGGY